MNPCTNEQRHIRHLIDNHIDISLNEQDYEKFYVQVNRNYLKLAQWWNYEIDYHQEQLNAQIKRIEELEINHDFLKNMLRQHNQSYDYKYHNFIKRQQAKLKRNKWNTFVKNRQTDNLSLPSSSND